MIVAQDRTRALAHLKAAVGSQEVIMEIGARCSKCRKPIPAGQKGTYSWTKKGTTLRHKGEN